MNTQCSPSQAPSTQREDTVLISHQGLRMMPWGPQTPTCSTVFIPAGGRFGMGGGEKQRG